MPDQISSLAVTDRTIGAYLDTLGSADPTPGGGSAAGVIGALGASLGLMVISLTTSAPGEPAERLAAAKATLDELQNRFTDLARQDEQVYQGYRDAAAMPKGTREEKTERRERMQSALKSAATVPLAMARACAELAETLGPVREFGNPYLLSDAQIAMLSATACFEACRVNVNVNLAMIRDDAWISDASMQLESLAGRIGKFASRT